MGTLMASAPICARSIRSFASGSAAESSSSVGARSYSGDFCSHCVSVARISGADSSRSAFAFRGCFENGRRRFRAAGKGGGQGVKACGTTRGKWENSIVMKAGGDKNDRNSGDDRVETLFMRELRRRGMSSKESEAGSPGSNGTDTKIKEQQDEEAGPAGRGWPLPGAWKTKPPPELTEAEREDQLKRSMALNSEGLDGLIPRAKELLKLGSSFFLFFWPFIGASLVAFLAVYFYFGEAFVHTGNSYEKVGRPPYVDPYQLLEEKTLPPQIGPDRVPFSSRTDDSP